MTAPDEGPRPPGLPNDGTPADLPREPAAATGPGPRPAQGREAMPPSVAAAGERPGEPSATTTATTVAEPAAPPVRRRRKDSFWRELPFLIVIALVLALLIKTFLVQAFFIPSGSMEKTLHGCEGCHGDRVLVNKLVYRIRDIHRGEIIVFRGPESWDPEVTISEPSNPVARFLRDIGSALGVAAPNEKDFIKRVIGIPGDHVVCCDAKGRVMVNGHSLDEPYIYPGDKPSDQTFDVTVPKGRLWVMGDHRGASFDSRGHITDGHLGTVPTGNVIGRAFVVVWPPSRWGTLPVPSTFHQKGLAAAAANAAPLALGVVGAVPVAALRRRRRIRRRAR